VSARSGLFIAWIPFITNNDNNDNDNDSPRQSQIDSTVLRKLLMASPPVSHHKMDNAKVHALGSLLNGSRSSLRLCVRPVMAEATLGMRQTRGRGRVQIVILLWRSASVKTDRLKARSHPIPSKRPSKVLDWVLGLDLLWSLPQWASVSVSRGRRGIALLVGPLRCLPTLMFVV